MRQDFDGFEINAGDHIVHHFAARFGLHHESPSRIQRVQTFNLNIGIGTQNAGFERRVRTDGMLEKRDKGRDFAVPNRRGEIVGIGIAGEIGYEGFAVERREICDEAQRRVALIIVAKEINKINGDLRGNSIKSPASDQKIETGFEQKRKQFTPNRRADRSILCRFPKRKCSLSTLPMIYSFTIPPRKKYEKLSKMRQEMFSNLKLSLSSRVLDRNAWFEMIKMLNSVTFALLELPI